MLREIQPRGLLIAAGGAGLVAPGPPLLVSDGYCGWALSALGIQAQFGRLNLVAGLAGIFLSAIATSGISDPITASSHALMGAGLVLVSASPVIGEQRTQEPSGPQRGDPDVGGRCPPPFRLTPTDLLW